MLSHRLSRLLARPLGRFILPAALASAATSAVHAGTWTRLAHNAPGAVNLMLLLPDGTVMTNSSSVGNAWYHLTPDSHGSYVNGTWSVLATSIESRLYFPSQVLRDDRVFVAGGEYGSGGPHAEVFDPHTNHWTDVTPSGTLWNVASDNFFDCNSETLPDGRVLVMPVFPHSPGMSIVYDPATNTWAKGGKLVHGSYQDEATWVKLPDDSILTIDPFGQLSERYIPSMNKWVNDGVVPIPMYDPFGGELGGGQLLSTGQAFYLGATGHTALYSPSGTSSPGVWTQGPDIPAGQATPDAPCASLVTGNVLCAVSPAPTASNHFPGPTSFYEYDPIANSFTQVGAPNGLTEGIATFQTAMLALPDGTVMYSHMGGDTYVYTPSGAPLAAAKPTITSITQNADGTFHLVGTGLNGISEGASYGDDFQMNSNYPLVRLSDGVSTYYAETFNWSTTAVATGSTPVSTEFRISANIPIGAYSLYVVANGIASDPTPFNACTPPVVYCTAKVNSQLCVPAIAYNGQASVTSPSPFHITASQMLNNKSGLLFYSYGASGAPFQGGFLCCQTPVARTSVQNSGGSASGTDCSGSYSFDFNGWIQAGKDPNLLPTAVVYAQYWARDPQDFDGFATSLSDALSFTICPR